MAMDMKRLWVFLAVCWIALSLGAYPYKVNVSSSLNMRSEPSVKSEILLKLQNGDIVDCPLAASELQGKSDWVQVNYQGTTGYLKAQYLVLAENPSPKSSAPVRMKQWYKLLDWEGDGYRWMAALIGVLTLFMWFECKFIRHSSLNVRTEDGENYRKWAVINGVLLTITSSFILFYVAKMGSNSLWFFMHSFVNSWWLIIVNFIFFIYVLVNLLVFFLMTLKDVSMTANRIVNLKFGIYTWLLGLIALVIWGIGGYDPTYIYWGIGICQVIQIGIILFQLAGKNLLTALAVCFLYALGSVSIAILAACMVFVLVALVIIAIVLAVTLKINLMPGGILSDKDGTPNEHGCPTADGLYTIINAEGMRTRLRQLEGNMYDGDDGHLYRRIGDSFHRV